MDNREESLTGYHSTPFESEVKKDSDCILCQSADSKVMSSIRIVSHYFAASCRRECLKQKHANRVSDEPHASVGHADVNTG